MLFREMQGEWRVTTRKLGGIRYERAFSRCAKAHQWSNTKVLGAVTPITERRDYRRISGL